MTEKYLSVIQQRKLEDYGEMCNMVKEWFNAKIELHQGLSLNPFLG